MKIINLPFDEFTNKGISCYEERNYRKAIAFFDKAIRKDNEAVVAYSIEDCQDMNLISMKKRLLTTIELLLG